MHRQPKRCPASVIANEYDLMLSSRPGSVILQHSCSAPVAYNLSKKRHAYNMCTETAYTLRCEHVVTRTLYCSEAPPPSRKERRACSRVIRNAVPWPPPPQFGTQATCPLANCPFEERGGYWNCCWCGKEWNSQGELPTGQVPDTVTDALGKL